MKPIVKRQLAGLVNSEGAPAALARRTLSNPALGDYGHTYQRDTRFSIKRIINYFGRVQKNYDWLAPPDAN